MIPSNSTLLLIITACLLYQVVVDLIPKLAGKLYFRLRWKQVRRNLQRAGRFLLRRPQP